MGQKTTGGTLCFQRFDKMRGLLSRTVTVNSLEQLLASAIKLRRGETLERVVVKGVDAEGNPRELVLSFRSERALSIAG